MGLDSSMAAAASGETIALATAAARPGVGGAIVDDVRVNALHEWLAARRGGGAGRGAVLALAGTDLCRHWSMTAPAGVASLRELQSIALTRCCRLFGGGPGDWRVTADWSLNRPMVCAALPATEVGALQAAATRAGLGLQIESALLKVVSALEPWLPGDGWSAWPTPASLVLLQRQGRRATWLQTFRREPVAETRAMVEEVSRQIRRHGLRNGEPALQVLYWLGATEGDGAGYDGPARVEPLSLPVNLVVGVPSWLRYAGVSEAQWAAGAAGAAA